MNPDELKQTLAADTRPLVLEFWAPWCAPCRRMAPVLEKISTQYTGRVRLVKVNADESVELAQSLKVMGIPTIIAYAQGTEVQRHTGTTNDTQLQSIFAALAAGDKPAKVGPSAQDRILRLSGGGALAVIGLGFGPIWPLVILGALIAFAGVYDHCPIYNAIVPRVKSWLKTSH